MPYCARCGSEHGSDDRFCVLCGATLGAAASPDASQIQAAAATAADDPVDQQPDDQAGPPADSAPEPESSSGGSDRGRMPGWAVFVVSLVATVAVVLAAAGLYGLISGEAVSIVDPGSSVLAEGLAPLDAAHGQLKDFQHAVDAGMSYGDILIEWPHVSVAFQASVDEFDRAALPESDRCDSDQWLAFLLLAHDSWQDFRDGVAMFVEGSSLPEDLLVSAAYSIAEASTDISETLRESALAPGDGCKDLKTTIAPFRSP